MYRVPGTWVLKMSTEKRVFGKLNKTFLYFLPTFLPYLMISLNLLQKFVKLCIKYANNLAKNEVNSGSTHFSSDSEYPKFYPSLPNSVIEIIFQKNIIF